MRLIPREPEYKCAVCGNFFEEDEHDRFVQLHHNKPYCSFQCIVKERFNTTPEVISWLISEYWRNTAPNEFNDWRTPQ